MLRANYFDGVTAKRHEVTLRLSGSTLRISGDGIERGIALSEITISEPLGNAPRILRFPDNAFCEVHEQVALKELLTNVGFRDKAIVRWQQNWAIAASSLVGFVIIIILGYRFGLPILAKDVAERIPDPLAYKLGAHVLDVLDQGIFKPSELPKARQQILQQRFAQLKRPDHSSQYQIVFRDSEAMGPNALALPSGTIVLLDELVDLAKDDNEVLAVLAHELGHLRYRHSLRILLQSSAVALVLAWYLGDISSLLASAPAAIIQAKYSRDFELEADAYAAKMLKLNNIASSNLISMLKKLEESHHQKRGREKQSDFLSTHPATAERIELLYKNTPEQK